MRSVNDFKTVNTLVSENIGLARQWANSRSDIDRDDAFSEALQILQNAAEEWDTESEIPFGAFAGQKLKWGLSDFARKGKAKKRGGHLQKLSFDAPLGEDGDAELHDVIADDQAEDGGDAADKIQHQAEQAHNLRVLRAKIRSFGPKTRYVLRHRLALGSSQWDLARIGRKLGLTKERVRQIEENGLIRIQEMRRNGLFELSTHPRIKKLNHRTYYLNNRATIRDRSFRYYIKNRARICARVRKWIRDNYDYVQQQKAAYRAKHRERLRHQESQRTRSLGRSYVRFQIHRRTGKPLSEITERDVETKRIELWNFRRRLQSAPRCPRCAGRLVKSGWNKTSNRQNYLCRGCGRMTVFTAMDIAAK